MADDAGRSRLGRGLASLIGDVGAEAGSTMERPRNQRRVPIEFLKPNARNPRRDFSTAELDELAGSIKDHGIIQPIVVRPVAGSPDHYEIIAGERRWRAAQRAGLHEVPVVSLDVSDEEALELAIIENVQRADLNPIEEAGGYRTLADEYKHSQDEIAKIVGKSRSHVANTMRLLTLAQPLQDYVRDGRLSAGHARMLIGQPNALEFAETIVQKGLNVRQVEAWVRSGSEQKAGARKRSGGVSSDPDAQALAKRLTDALGLTVKIEHRADGSGALSIRYRDVEQLDEIARRLERESAGPQPLRPSQRIRGL
jgi:ParB family chromosome partitioning protein